MGAPAQLDDTTTVGHYPNGIATIDRYARCHFEGRHGADEPDQLAPVVNMADTELNTLAAHGVKRSNARFVVVYHSTRSRTTSRSRKMDSWC